MLLPLVQHGTSPELHEGRVTSHEYLGTRPQAIKDAATTPSGWKVDSQASRMRRFVGRNSSVMVASIGMLPASKAEAKGLSAATSAERSQRVLYEPTANPKADARGDEADAAVVGGRGKDEAEDRGDQAGDIEAPTPTDDVAEQAPVREGRVSRPFFLLGTVSVLERTK